MSRKPEKLKKTRQKRTNGAKFKGIRTISAMWLECACQSSCLNGNAAEAVKGGGVELGWVGAKDQYIHTYSESEFIISASSTDKSVSRCPLSGQVVTDSPTKITQKRSERVKWKLDENIPKKTLG